MNVKEGERKSWSWSWNFHSFKIYLSKVIVGLYFEIKMRKSENVFNFVLLS